MQTSQTSNCKKRPWALNSIPFNRIDRTRIQCDESLFFVLAAASLIESGSDIYTQLLVDHYGERSEIANWLATQWEREELQHGQALRLYIEHAWPEFEWSETRKNFLVEYSSYCSAANLEQSPALELLARCVIETGTAALYRALHSYTEEPVLKQLTANIWSDEVRHYSYFHRYFNRYNQVEKNGRWRILKTLGGRLSEIRNEDADCALRHIFAMRYPGEACDSAHFRAISTQARALIVRNMSSDMMIKMFLKPLDVPARWRPYVHLPLINAMNRFLAA